MYICPFCSYPHSAKPTASLKQQNPPQMRADREGAIGLTCVGYTVVPLWVYSLKSELARPFVLFMFFVHFINAFMSQAWTKTNVKRKSF